MSTLHPVTPTFLIACSSVSSDGRGGVTWLGATLYPTIGEGGAWAFGRSTGITMSGATLTELQHATGANEDGSYETAAGTRVLALTSAGAAEPGNPPPP